MRTNSRGMGLVAFAVGLAILALNGEAIAGEPGAKCEVTSGPNKGKTGTYGDGGSWCEDGWGGTECTDQQGTSKCKDALLVSDGGGVVVVDGKNGAVSVTTGLYQTPDKGPVRCTTSTSAVPLSSTAVCFPVHVDKLEQLTTSKDETSRSIAEAVNTAIRHLPAKQ